jgi:hypothetical protein
LVELQFKHKSEEIVRSQFEEERRREIEARSQFEEEEDQNTDLFSVSKLTRRSRSLLKDLSFESPNKSRYIQKTFSFLLIIIIEGLKSKINGESKKDFEKDSKKFGRNPRNVNRPRFTVYFINLGSNP